MKHKRLVEILFFIIFLQNIMLILFSFLYYQKISIKDIYISSNFNDDLTRKMKISIKSNNKDYIYCSIDNKESWTKAKNNKCYYNVSNGTYKIYIRNKKKIISKIKTINYDYYKDLKIDKKILF